MWNIILMAARLSKDGKWVERMSKQIDVQFSLVECSV